MKFRFLNVYTSRLKEQLQFYNEVLNLPVNKVSNSSFQIQIGYSLLEFSKSRSTKPYHVAFHIPARMEEQALEWLKKRVSILRAGNEEIIDFPAWQARSIYFYDQDRNIIEFISRKKLFEAGVNEFTAEQIIGISEIGLATENVGMNFKLLNDNYGLQKFTGDYERFCATGDDEGLFIIIDKHNKNWIPTGDTAYASPFEIEFSNEGAIYRTAYKNDRLQLL